MMTKQELERWLCGVDRRSDISSIEHVLDLPLETLVESVLPGVPEEQSQLRFTVALLRDIFSNDGDARRWLSSPHTELGDRRPLELFTTGRIADVEMLLVNEWQLAAARQEDAGARGGGEHVLGVGSSPMTVAHS